MPPALRHARAIGAAGLGYVLLAGVENMELLRAPVFGAPAAEIRAAYADGALAAVTIGAGALSLACFAVFAAGLAARDRAAFAGAVAGLLLAAAALFAGAVLAATAGDLSDATTESLLDARLTLRLLSGPCLALFILRASRGLARPLAAVARPLAVALALTPLAALAHERALLVAALVVFGLHSLWIAGLSLAWTAGSARRAAFLLLVIAAGLVGAALLAVPGATGAFFAWPLAPEPLAAWAGGVYVGAAAVYAAGLRVPASAARPLLAGAVVLSSSVFAITLAHLDLFDLGRLQAWAWLVLFAGFALTTAVLLRRSPGARPDAPAVHAAARAALAVVAVALAGIAAVLWADPAAEPFALAPLGGRFAGSWVALLATTAGWAAWTGRRDEAHLAALRCSRCRRARCSPRPHRHGASRPPGGAGRACRDGELVLAAARRYSQPARLNPRCSASAQRTINAITSGWPRPSPAPACARSSCRRTTRRTSAP